MAEVFKCLTTIVMFRDKWAPIADNGEFLARAASAGVQVIVETHSDHVLNGVRRAVREVIVSHEDVIIHFFQPRSVAEREGTAQVITPTINANGNIDHWPAGFFDQFEKDLGYR